MVAVRYEHGIRPTDAIRWVFGITALAVIIYGIILMWNRRLNREIDERLKVEEALREERDKLQITLSETKILTGLLPICANCKKVRDARATGRSWSLTYRTFRCGLQPQHLP